MFGLVFILIFHNWKLKKKSYNYGNWKHILDVYKLQAKKIEFNGTLVKK